MAVAVVMFAGSSDGLLVVVVVYLVVMVVVVVRHISKRQPRLAIKQGTVQKKTGDCPQVSRFGPAGGFRACRRNNGKMFQEVS